MSTSRAQLLLALICVSSNHRYRFRKQGLPCENNEDREAYLLLSTDCLDNEYSDDLTFSTTCYSTHWAARRAATSPYTSTGHQQQSSPLVLVISQPVLELYTFSVFRLLSCCSRPPLSTTWKCSSRDVSEKQFEAKYAPCQRNISINLAEHFLQIG